MINRASSAQTVASIELYEIGQDHVERATLSRSSKGDSLKWGEMMRMERGHACRIALAPMHCLQTSARILTIQISGPRLEDHPHRPQHDPDQQCRPCDGRDKTDAQKNHW